MTQIHRCLVALTCSTAILALATPCLAQDVAASGDDDRNPGLEDIVVTAQRRETPLQQTPVAITSISGQTIKDRGISNLSDLGGQVPGLAMPGLSSQRTAALFYIRGIGEAETHLTPSVGIYIDDVYMSRGWGAVYDLPGITQIEVLRGPQGTLFGRNTSAGLINIRTADPGKQLNGYVSVEYGENNEFVARALVSGPISDTLSGSLSFVHHTRDGYIRNLTLGRDLNAVDTNAVRAKLAWAPTDRRRVDVTADGVLDRSDASVYAPVNQPNGIGKNPYDPDKVWVSVSPDQKLRAGGVSLRALYDVTDRFKLKAITAYRDSNDKVVNVNDGGTSYIFNESFSLVKNNSFQQEVQALYDSGNLHIVAGLFYFRESYDLNRVVWAGGKKANVGTTTYVITRTDIESWAAYGQAELELFDDVFVTAGLRYSRDANDIRNYGYVSATNFTSAGPQDLPSVREANATGVYDVTAHQSFSAATPKVQLRYQWTPDIMTYASYSRGYHSGGFDNRATTPLTAITPFKPEDVDAFEVGLKATFLDNRLRANIAGFYQKFKDIQIRAYDDTIAVYRRINAAGAHTQGVELEINTLPFANFELNGSAAFLEAEYDESTAAIPANPAGVTSLKGKKLYFAPRWTYTVDASYRVPLAGGWIRANGVLRYRSMVYTDPYNTQQLISPSQYLVNASLVWTDQDDRWSLGIYAENLFNNRGNQGGTYSPTAGPTAVIAGGGQYVYANNPPRAVRAGLKYAF